MLIAGDIGRTKIDLAILLVKAGQHSSVAPSTVDSADYPSLQAIVKEFLARATRQSYGVATPTLRNERTDSQWLAPQKADMGSTAASIRNASARSGGKPVHSTNPHRGGTDR